MHVQQNESSIKAYMILIYDFGMFLMAGEVCNGSLALHIVCFLAVNFEGADLSLAMHGCFF